MVTTVKLKAIREFRGRYLFLSNFYPWEGQRQVAELAWVEFEGIRYPSSEHAYQAAKYGPSSQYVEGFGDRMKQRIADLTRMDLDRKRNPAAQAKAAGRQIVSPWDRYEWNERKDAVMLDVVRAKFRQNPHLARALLATGSAYLEEGNWWGDRYWGVSPVGSGDGLNRLGQTLMVVRGELRG